MTQSSRDIVLYRLDRARQTLAKWGLLQVWGQVGCQVGFQVGSGQDKHLHLLQKLPNYSFLHGLKHCSWHLKGRFKPVLILKRYSGDAIVPLR